MLGSKFGNILSAMGKKSSPAGTIMKTENGTRRPRSLTVRSSCINDVRSNDD